MNLVESILLWIAADGFLYLKKSLPSHLKTLLP